VNHRIAGALVASALTAAPIATTADTPRQSQVEKKSEQVMPFDMSAALHHFVPTSEGGVQTVLVRTGDPKQVALVRSHLRTEAAKFAGGDFHDPASIHGGEMPGLKAMRDGAARISVRYDDIANGGKITYASANPALVAAIHAWFKAQVSDHGAHATMKM
jgi:hypothetical protein